MKKLNRTKLTPSTLNRSQEQIKTKPILTQANTPASSALISTMKMELSSIKQDVEKLMSDEVQTENQPEFKETNRVEECYKENEVLRAKYDKVLEETTRMRGKNSELQNKLSELSKSKQRIEQEYQVLKATTAKLESEESAIVKQEREKESQSSNQESKWKQAWMQLSGQVTLLEQQVKEKQHQIQGKDQEILQLGWELQDIKQQQNTQSEEQNNSLQNKIQGEIERYREELKSREREREKQREVERQRERERERERNVEREKSRERERERKGEAQKEIERENEREAERERVGVLEKNNQKLRDVIEELTAKGQSDSQTLARDFDSITRRNKELEVQIQKQRNETGDLRTKAFNLIHDKQNLEETVRALTEQIKTISLSRSEETRRFLDDVSKLKVKLNQQQVLNLKLQNSLSLSQAESSTNSITFIKQTQLLHEINQKTTEIVALKSELEESKKVISSLKNQSESQKMRVYSGERSVKNHFEIELINKKSELESVKRKMDALNKKVESRTSQLRQKDQFILNTIVNKVNREGSQTEAEYVKKELQKHFSTTLSERLAESQKEIQTLRAQIQGEKQSTSLLAKD